MVSQLQMHKPLPAARLHPTCRSRGSQNKVFRLLRAVEDPDVQRTRYTSSGAYDASPKSSVRKAVDRQVEDVEDFVDGISDAAEELDTWVEDVSGAILDTLEPSAKQPVAQSSREWGPPSRGTANAPSPKPTPTKVVERTVERVDAAVTDALDVSEAIVNDFSNAVLDAMEPTPVNRPSVQRAAAPRETPQEWGQPSRGTAPPPPPPAQEVVEQAPDDRFKEFKKVLVAGGTGGVGRKVIAELVAKGVQVVAIVRDPEAARKRLPGLGQGLTLVKGDVYQYGSLPRALQGCDAVICATGATQVIDPLGPFNTDYSGTVNLVAASQHAGIKHFVLVTSIGTDDPIFNPLNLFWGILFWKKRAEEHLQRSGLKYTIVRPGGLVSDDVRGTKNGVYARGSGTRGEGNVVMASAGTYGIPPKKAAGSIKRRKVAQCCVEALVQPQAADKVVEVISERSAPILGWEDLFEGVKS